MTEKCTLNTPAKNRIVSIGFELAMPVAMFKINKYLAVKNSLCSKTGFLYSIFVTLQRNSENKSKFRHPVKKPAK